MAAGLLLQLDGEDKVNVLEHCPGACSVTSSVGTVISTRTAGFGDTKLIKLCNRRIHSIVHA